MLIISLAKSRNGRFPINIALILFTIFFAFLSTGVSLAQTKPLVKGQYLPNLPFTDSLSKDERTYLGLTAGKKLSLKDIRCSVIIIEIFNTYCTSCPRNIPVINELYSRSENDPKFKGKIKIIGIAAGNTREEIIAYKKTHSVSYPIFSDLNFTLHKALGNPRVPYTMLIKKNRQGKDKIIYTHQGIIDSPEPLLEIVGKHLN
jgi:thiol-disulfide isomerase/thioredoxin